MYKFYKMQRILYTLGAISYCVLVIVKPYSFRASLFLLSIITATNYFNTSHLLQPLNDHNGIELGPVFTYVLFLSVKIFTYLPFIGHSSH